MSLTDNYNGTVTDDVSGLMWEKKGAMQDIHNWRNSYSWSKPEQSGTARDGTAFTEFLATLNSKGFAGHADWRLPTVAELRSIVDRSRAPAINEIFGHTQAWYYWSIEDSPGVGPFYALEVNFGRIDNSAGLPEIQNGHKVENYQCYYRAVRNNLVLETGPIPRV